MDEKWLQAIILMCHVIIGCGGILLTGSHGSGKTSVVRKLIQDLHHDSKALICKCFEYILKMRA